MYTNPQQKSQSSGYGQNKDSLWEKFLLREFSLQNPSWATAFEAASKVSRE